MERLTKTYKDGTHRAADNLPCGENSWEYKTLLLERLGAYEDTGLTPKKIMNGKLLTGWIPAAERLPIQREDVIITVEKLGVTIAWYSDVTKTWENANTDKIIPNVIAWMPLPEPYKPETLREAGKEAGTYADAPTLQSAT